MRQRINLRYILDEAIRVVADCGSLSYTVFMIDSMGDVGVSESVIGLNKVELLSPYHPDGEYSDEEVTKLTEFMHGATSKWSAGGVVMEFCQLNTHHRTL